MKQMGRMTFNDRVYDSSVLNLKSQICGTLKISGNAYFTQILHFVEKTKISVTTYNQINFCLNLHCL